jgi:hypothetical protein
VGDLLDLGLQADHVRGYLAEDGCRGVLGGLVFPAAASARASRVLIIWMVMVMVMVTGWPGAGLRRAARLA